MCPVMEVGVDSVRYNVSVIALETIDANIGKNYGYTACMTP